MHRAVLLSLLVVGIAGCGAVQPMDEAAQSRSAKKEARRAVAGAGAFGEEKELGKARDDLVLAAPPAQAAVMKEARQPLEDKAVSRKLIYTADMDVIVDDLDKAKGELVRLLEERKGYITKSDLREEPGAPRSGTWTVRVPAAKFSEFIEAVAGLGEVRRNALDSSDVTDSYYDTKAHIKTLEVAEQGLQKLYLKKSADSKLDELVALHKEMDNIRSQIEQKEKQVQRWDRDVAYSTATVILRDRKDYVPPIVPDFGGRIGSTFQASVQALVDVGKFLVIAVVALAPWLVVLAILSAPIVYLVRRRWRRQEPLVVVAVEENKPSQGGQSG